MIRHHVNALVQVDFGPIMIQGIQGSPPLAVATAKLPELAFGMDCPADLHPVPYSSLRGYHRSFGALQGRKGTPEQGLCPCLSSEL